MHYHFIQPNHILKPFIKNYWILEDLNVTGNSCRHRIIPSGFSEMIFYYGDRYLSIDSNNNSEALPIFQISGQKKEFYDVQATGKIGLIAVTFKPDAAKLFLKIPVSEIKNISVSLEDIYGIRIKEFESKWKEALNNKERINLIETFLIKQLNESLKLDYNRINYSLRFIDRNKGIVSVEKLAQLSCLSTRQFNRKFTEYVGLNPKQFTRIVRFQNTIYTQQQNLFENFTDVAYQCGYYDQAHFINEFKLFTGYTPVEFFKTGEVYSDYFS
jgi:AraC-like DNA-binding protein